MKDATDKQRNVSSVIKDGLEEMKGALDRLKEERGIRKKAVERMMSALRAQAPGAGESTRFSTPEVGSKKSKRMASSPAESQGTTPSEKTRREEVAKTEWSQVVGRKARKERPQDQEGPLARRRENHNVEQKNLPRKPRKRQRRKALLIKLADGKTYAEVLRNIRMKVKPEETTTDIRSIRQTKNGYLKPLE